MCGRLSKMGVLRAVAAGGTPRGERARVSSSNRLTRGLSYRLNFSAVHYMSSASERFFFGSQGGMNRSPVTTLSSQSIRTLRFILLPR